MQVQTIFQTGNSSVVAIPKYLLKEVGFKKGQKVLVEKSPEGEAVIVRKASQSSKSPAATAEFKKWLDGVLKEDAQILDELAVR